MRIVFTKRGHRRFTQAEERAMESLVKGLRFD